MTLKDLEQIIYMKSEIDMLNKRLHKERSKGNQLVGDYIKDYSTGQERIMTIHGYTMTDSKKINEIWLLLETRKNRLEERVLKAEQYIASISDSKIRVLLTLRFIEGREWRDVGKGFYKMSADTARKCVQRFFEKK